MLGLASVQLSCCDVSNALVVRVCSHKLHWQNVRPQSTGIVCIFVVLVERDHLVEDLLGDLVDGRQLEGCDRHLNVAEPPNNWLHFRVVHSVHWLDNHKVVLLLNIFENGSLDGREMLLVRQVDVVEEGALPGEEGAGQFKGLCVPELALLLLHRRVKGHVFFHLNDKPNLR